MATAKLASIETYRQEQKHKVVQQELIKKNNPSWWERLWGAKKNEFTYQQVWDYFAEYADSTRGDCPSPGEFAWIENTYGNQADTCRNVIRACKYAKTNTITLSLDDLRKIS